MNYYYVLKKLSQKTQIIALRQPHCFNNLKNIKKISDNEIDIRHHDKLVNAGGFGVKGLYSRPCNLSFTEGVTIPFGRGGVMFQNVVRRVIATQTPALAIF